MALPEPQAGLVIRYSYLWHSEFLEGREDGVKDRPCAIVAAIKQDADGDTRVLVLPVTHSPPAKGTPAVEIPATIKKRLKLDAERSWIVLSEWNEFVWPGPDLRRGAGGDEFERGLWLLAAWILRDSARPLRGNRATGSRRASAAHGVGERADALVAKAGGCRSGVMRSKYGYEESAGGD